MATTTNYGWTTPDDTALVKDGASAIRTLGSSVDTTTKALNPETTLGDLAYRSSTANVKTRLGLGTAGQVLQVNSGATAPEWATPSIGGMTLLATTTLSGTSTVVSSIAQTYNSLVIVGTGLTWSANAHFYINPNSTASNVEAVGNYDGGYVFATNIAPLSNGTIASNSANGFVAQISNYTIAGRKPVLFYGNHASGSRASNFGGASYHSSAITSLQYTTAAGTATLGGTIYLYGVK
jgi:hypothetical protein